METSLSTDSVRTQASLQDGRLHELVERATALFGRDDFGGARDALLEALELEGEQVDLVLFLANIYYHMRDLTAARAQYERAVELDPRHVSARISLAGLLAETEQFEAAEVAVRAALGFEPDSQRALRFLAGLLLRNGRVSEANETFAALLAGVITQGLDPAGDGVVEAELVQKPESEMDIGESMPVIGTEPVATDPAREEGRESANPGPSEGVERIEQLVERARGLPEKDRTELLGQLALLTQTEHGDDPPGAGRVESAFQLLLGTLSGLADAEQAVELVTELAEKFRETTELPEDLLPIPPASLRGPDESVETFLNLGQEQQVRVRLGLELACAKRDEIQTILDFGCGCGRVLRHWIQRAEGKKIYGTDVDERAIRWCSRNLPIGICTVNDVMPPLSHSKAMFDLAYSFFGFPKRDERVVFHWMAELSRVVKPEGVVLLAVKGESDTVRDLSPRFFTIVGEMPDDEGTGGLLVLRNKQCGR